MTNTIESGASNELNFDMITANMASNIFNNITHIATMGVVQFVLLNCARIYIFASENSNSNHQIIIIDLMCCVLLCKSGFITHREIIMTSSNRNIFRVTGLCCGEFTGHRRIPRTKASDA